MFKSSKTEMKSCCLVQPVVKIRLSPLCKSGVELNYASVCNIISHGLPLYIQTDFKNDNSETIF